MLAVLCSIISGKFISRFLVLASYFFFTHSVGLWFASERCCVDWRFSFLVIIIA